MLGNILKKNWLQEIKEPKIKGEDKK